MEYYDNNANIPVDGQDQKPLIDNLRPLDTSQEDLSLMDDIMVRIHHMIVVVVVVNMFELVEDSMVMM